MKRYKKKHWAVFRLKKYFGELILSNTLNCKFRGIQPIIKINIKIVQKSVHYPCTYTIAILALNTQHQHSVLCLVSLSLLSCTLRLLVLILSNLYGYGALIQQRYFVRTTLDIHCRKNALRSNHIQYTVHSPSEKNWYREISP